MHGGLEERIVKQLLSDAIDSYADFRRSQGLAKNTLRHDRTVLKHFLANVGNVWCHSLTERHVTIHFSERSKTCASASLRVDHATLSTFFAWCRHTRRMAADSNPLYGRRMGGQVERERHRIHVSKFPLLLDLAEQSHPRNRALVAVLLYTLLRGSDASSLRVGDVELDAGYIRASIRKTHREDRIPVSAELDTEVRAWLRFYTEECGKLDPRWYLLPARQVAPIREGPSYKIIGHVSRLQPTKRLHQVSEIVNPILERLGVPLVDEDGNRTREGGHTLRRSGARALFDAWRDAGYDGAMRTVQAMLHHKSITQTERYLGLTADRLTRDELVRGKTLFPAAEQAARLERIG